MINVSIVTPDCGDACSVYRAVGPYMKLPINIKIYNSNAGFLLWESVQHCEVVMIQRAYTETQLNIAKVFKMAGKKIIIDWDDDLSAVTPSNPNYEAFQNCEQTLRGLAQIADVVTVSSPILRSKAYRWGAKRVELLLNAIDDSYRKLQKLPRSNNIVWRGSNTHSADIMLAKDMIIKLGEENKIVFMGYPPPWASEVKNQASVGVLDYANYITFLNSIAPKMFLVPLEDNEFNRAKSDIGAQEAYLVGAELWHNNVGMYKNLPSHGPVRWLSEVNELRMQILRGLV